MVACKSPFHTCQVANRSHLQIIFVPKQLAFCRIYIYVIDTLTARARDYSRSQTFLQPLVLSPCVKIDTTLTASYHLSTRFPSFPSSLPIRIYHHQPFRPFSTQPIRVIAYGPCVSDLCGFSIYCRTRVALSSRSSSIKAGHPCLLVLTPLYSTNGSFGLMVVSKNVCQDGVVHGLLGSSNLYHDSKSKTLFGKRSSRHLDSRFDRSCVETRFLT